MESMLDWNQIRRLRVLALKLDGRTGVLDKNDHNIVDFQWLMPLVYEANIR